MENVAVIGASPKQDRYSNKAVRMLAEYHHIPIPVTPRRVIFNPNTENKDAYEPLKQAGIEVVEACTLVLLKTSQY